MISKSHDTFESFIKHYWQYYKELEDEIIATRRYVDFDQGNFSTFSVEYLKLYQTICSEIDVLGKAIAHEIDPEDIGACHNEYFVNIRSKILTGISYNDIIRIFGYI